MASHSPATLIGNEVCPNRADRSGLIWCVLMDHTCQLEYGTSCEEWDEIQAEWKKEEQYDKEMVS